MQEEGVYVGIFSVSKQNDHKKFESLLIEGERIEAVYRLRHDQICFTNKRLIFGDNRVFSKRKSGSPCRIDQLKVLPFKKLACLIRTLVCCLLQAQKYLNSIFLKIQI